MIASGPMFRRIAGLLQSLKNSGRLARGRRDSHFAHVQISPDLSLWIDVLDGGRDTLDATVAGHLGNVKAKHVKPPGGDCST
jgi:hypothetical protein